MHAPKHLSTVENAYGKKIAVETEIEYIPRHMAAEKPSKAIRTAMLAVVFAIISATCLIAATANAEEAWSPFRFVLNSSQEAVEEAEECTSYVARGRTRVNLPNSILFELNDWAEAVSKQQNEWMHEDEDAGLENAEYYGGFEEGFNYAFQTILARLGYVDGYYMDAIGIDHHEEWASPNATLETVEEAMNEAGVLDTFYAWEDASFGKLADSTSAGTAQAMNVVL